jgi:hypothetical protein
LHLIFELLSFTLGFQYYQWLRKRVLDPITTEQRWFIFIGAAGGAFFGSHVLGILEQPDLMNQWTFVYFFANKTILGGLLGGLIGVELVKKIIGVHTSSGDLMTFPIMLGMGIGRVGCHLAGKADGTYGNPTTLPWGIDLGDGIPRHPVNLYEICFLASLAVFILWLENRRPLADGVRFKLFMIGYLLWRLCIERLKPVWFFPIGLSTLQIAAIAGLLYYTPWMLRSITLFSSKTKPN